MTLRTLLFLLAAGAPVAASLAANQAAASSDDHVVTAASANDSKLQGERCPERTGSHIRTTAIGESCEQQGRELGVRSYSREELDTANPANLSEALSKLDPGLTIRR